MSFIWVTCIIHHVLWWELIGKLGLNKVDNLQWPWNGMSASKWKALLKKRVLSELIILLLLLLDGGSDLWSASGSGLILSLSLDAGNIVGIANVEHLNSGPGLFHYHHHLLIGVRSDQRSRVYLADEETFVLLLSLLGLFESADNLVESWQAQVVSVHLLHIFVRS